MQKLILGSMLLATLGCGEPAAEEKEEPATETETWINMLEGGLAKWHRYNEPDSIGKAWSVTDGVLSLDASNKADWQASNGGDIVYDEVFDNFHLKLEWKIAPNGNSGIMFYVQEDTAFRYPWNTGPEMQVLDNEGHPDAKIYKHRAGDLYDLIAASPETVKPVGEWNLAEIISDNGTLEFYLNGEKVVSTPIWDSTWNAMIAGSKFKDMKGFGTYKSGKIALQDHGDHVWFRNVMIRRL